MEVSDALLKEFSDTVAAQVGLCFPQERWPDLLRGMTALAREFDFSGPEQCMRNLMAKPLSRHQVEMLASHLSVGETYFFRDTAMFAALEQEVLPRLIAARRATGKRLRIWSAGCCTGEEAYSIAIVISRLLPDLADWDVTIFGTDINPRFLNKAEHGVYRDWSFRSGPAWIKQGYFTMSEPGSYTILPRIKKMVRFEYLNLVDDIYPALENNTNAMDIVLCRNVLMYLESGKVKQIVHKMRRVLVEGGWLIVSPAESDPTLFSQFAKVNFQHILFYRKDSEQYVVPQFDQPSIDQAWTMPAAPEVVLHEAVNNGLDAGSPTTDIDKPLDEPPATPYQTALAFYKQGAYEHVAALLATAGCDSPPALALLARAYANQGRLIDAGRWCEAAIAADKCDCGLRYLLAVIMEEQGRIDDAATSLKRALYLDHNFVLAHFALGNLYRRQGKEKYAAKHFTNAVSLLNGYPASDILPESEGMTAGRLIEIIRARESAA